MVWKCKSLFKNNLDDQKPLNILANTYKHPLYFLNFVSNKKILPYMIKRSQNHTQKCFYNFGFNSIKTRLTLDLRFGITHPNFSFRKTSQSPICDNPLNKP